MRRIATVTVLASKATYLRKLLASHIESTSSHYCMSLQISAFPQRDLSAPNANAPAAARPRPNRTTLSIQEAKEIWQHTVLLFKHYDWSEAVVYTQRLLRRSRHTPGINRAAVWANLGILRMHLGEYYLALEAFTKAMKEAGISAAGAGSVGGKRQSLPSSLSPCPYPEPVSSPV